VEIRSTRKAARETWIGGSALRGPLLGVLLHQSRPIGAYRLATLLMQRLPAWQVTPSAVANLLKRLVQEGFVQPTPGPSKVYSATEDASRALEEWLRRPLARHPVREELHARIVSSAAHHAPLLLSALEAYERDCFEMLAASPTPEGARGSWTSLTINLTRAATDETVHANIRWSKIARRWIDEWLQDAAPQARQSNP
jgi:DNA-binding PadR family transcriptional regulator